MAGFDEEVDFVVVGSGGGSMAAGLYMRSAGLGVVVLEKMPRIGGTTSRSGGVMWIPNNPFMAKEGIEDSFEKSIAYMEATAGQSVDAPGTTEERRRAYVTEGPKMVDFLVGQGIRLLRSPYWPDYYDERPGGSAPGRTVVAEIFNVNELPVAWRDKLEPNFLGYIPAFNHEGFKVALAKVSFEGKAQMMKIGLRMIWGKLTGKKWISAGGALQGRMMKASLAAGVDLRVDSPVRHFVVEDGAVTGVETVRDGKPWRIRARRGVLVNAGGFSHNQAMRDRYQPGTSAKWTAATPGSTGEMILEMERIGAALGQMEEMVGNQMTIAPGGENSGDGVALRSLLGGQMTYAKPHSIVVDQSGVRYMNEGGSYMEFCQNLLKRERETGGGLPSWWISDQEGRDKYAGGTPPKDLIESGFIKTSDTIEGLAAQMGVDPATLRQTVDTFNGYARDGVDRAFGRGARAYDRYIGDFYQKDAAQSLGAIEKGPFYAAPVVPGDVGTYGGVVTDANARVLRPDGSVIEGLYATGVSTASVMGRIYPGAGASIGPSFTWGYVAAKHAAGAGNLAGAKASEMA